MKAQPLCRKCLIKQAENTIRKITDKKDLHQLVLSEAHKYASKVSLNHTPCKLSKPIYEIVSKVTGNPDPFKKEKQESNELALKLLPIIRNMIAESTDKLDACLHSAVAGNIIDLGIGMVFDLEKDLHKLMSQRFKIDDSDRLRNELKKGKRLLYVGDNAGEIVMDMPLIEYFQGLGVKVTYSVKSGPIINDSTMEDVKAVGLDKIVSVIETGSDDIGINWDNVSQEFRSHFESADIIICKGHGNFETCDETPGNIYFLLKAKCEVVAAKLGVHLGDIVVKKNIDN